MTGDELTAARAVVCLLAALAITGCSAVMPEPQYKGLGVCRVTLRDGTERPSCIYHDNGHFYCGERGANQENYGEGSWSVAVCNADAEAPR